MANNLFSEVQRERRRAGERSIEAFARIYLKHYLDRQACVFHKKLYAVLLNISEKRSERLAIAAPRGNAKSVIVSLAYILWNICYKKENYIWLLSDTKDQAVDLLSHVKAELESNKLLIEDFPDICEIGQKPGPSRWKKDEIITRNGVKITALGAGQKPRGRRNKAFRPSLIILDDIENDENTQSPDARDKLFDWFTKAILKAGSDNTNVIVIGTIQHYDSLLAKLTSNTDMPGWDKKIYKAVVSYANRQDLWQEWSVIFNNRGSYMGQSGKEAAYIFFTTNKEVMLEGTEVLWEEKENYYSLMVMREQDGTTSFDSEKQNNPIDGKGGLLNPEKFHYWDDQYPSEEILFEAMKDKLEIYGACDPSTGKQGKHNDYSAIITIAFNVDTKRAYVLDADIAKRIPHDLLDTIISYCRIREYSKFAIEANQFQDLLAQELERRSAETGLDIPIKPITNSSEKLGRIESLEAKINSGYLQFSRKHTLLLEQLKYFPKGRHDDGPDALEMAVGISKDSGEGGTFVDTRTGGGDDPDEPDEVGYTDLLEGTTEN